MRVTLSLALPTELAVESEKIGARLARLRVARHISQTEAALRAGISRNTAYRLEKGDPGVAIGQLLRYLDVIAPGKSLQSFFAESDPSIAALGERERKKRVRSLSKKELEELNF
ncbi:helix-turn-helix domain-containing protein [Solimicrobium silvestre]|uniref:Helix-turn-helix domain n=1 Tax=Solimicrobium silvestre TaxID=2099400 RepID=A0A2S9H388_9BURK|nr:helix-turn-helix transcriptional regulator [Solimicrobium silvestre]PRC94326.1 Helix-turn-helix domain [Solimicrobium silvestre]